MHDSYTGLYLGLAFSMLLAYLLMVVNFQSWVQPLIIITALPCALGGILWMLFVTGTTLSVPALMGAIMCMGVATANSVLVVTFANELLEKYKDPYPGVSRKVAHCKRIFGNWDWYDSEKLSAMTGDESWMREICMSSLKRGRAIARPPSTVFSSMMLSACTP